MTTPTPTPTPTSQSLAAPFAQGVEGVYFDGRSSRDRAATLRVLGSGDLSSGAPLAVLRVAPTDGEPGSEQQWPLRQVQFDPPLAGVRRVVKLPDGGRFETNDDRAITALEAAVGRNRGLRGVRRLESDWGLTLGAVVTLGLFVWGFLTYSLSSIYQGLGLTLLTTAVTGDLIGASTFAAAVPTWLLKNGYSRQSETQSDEVAGRFLMERYGTTKPLRDVLARLETEDENADENSVKRDDPGAFLQTHPGTAERIRHLREIEQNWPQRRGK